MEANPLARNLLQGHHCGLGNPVKPTILVLTTARWPTTARLGMAFASAGCSVDGVCPRRNPLALTSAARRIYPYSALTPCSSIREAIICSKPDLLVPTDDLATHHLLDLYAQSQLAGKEPESIAALIERSLGVPTNYRPILQRAQFIQLAKSEGVLVPETVIVSDPEELLDWIADAGFPMVLKADETSSGEGVYVARSPEQALEALRVLQAPPSSVVMLKRALLNADARWIRPWWEGTKSTVNAQAYVPGREANSTVACWQGNVLASLHFEVLEKRDPLGPSTVFRLLNCASMSSAIDKIVRRLSLSGIHGFDFILQESTGYPYLIEMNPRATQVGHLALGPGRDLTAALTAAVSGQPPRGRNSVTEKDTVALFPQEWLRDPTSPYLTSGYHDVPWEEPALVRDSIRRQRAWTKRYARTSGWLRKLLKPGAPSQWPEMRKGSFPGNKK
jgi:Carbamoyl-phosphate synthase L chain, ATP binding domain